jgi:hypothetical protein
MDHVPDRRRSRTQVRIVCEQRFSSDSSFTTDNPVVAGGKRFSMKSDAIEGGGRDLLVVRQFCKRFGRNRIAFELRSFNS